MLNCSTWNISSFSITAFLAAMALGGLAQMHFLLHVLHLFDGNLYHMAQCSTICRLIPSQVDLLTS